MAAERSINRDASVRPNGSARGGRACAQGREPLLESDWCGASSRKTSTRRQSQGVISEWRGIEWCTQAPVLVGQFEFLEWTGANNLQPSKFVALREDKSPRDVKRE